MRRSSTQCMRVRPAVASRPMTGTTTRARRPNCPMGLGLAIVPVIDSVRRWRLSCPTAPTTRSTFMPDRTSFSILEEVLVGGLQDWTHASWLHHIVRNHGVVDPLDRRAMCIGVISEALVAGLMVAGDPPEQTLPAWNCSTGEAIELITRRWQEWGTTSPNLGAIVWLENTPEGDAIAKAALARTKATEEESAPGSG